MAPGRRFPMRFAAYILTNVCFLLLAEATCSYAETYVVHPDGTGDYPNIQAAVNAASDGDIIELVDGVFTGTGNWNIQYNGKALTVRSQSDNPTLCIIDCEGQGWGFNFQSDETPAAILRGVTIMNAVEWTGGGVICNHSSPTIANCVLAGNTSTSQGGGGIHCSSASPILTDVIMRDNTAPVGGGMHIQFDSSPMLTNVTFLDNTADSDGGGGMSCWSSPNAILTDCTFSGNIASTGQGGGLRCSASSLTLTNVTFSGNVSSEGGALYCDDSSPVLSKTLIAFSVAGEAVACRGSSDPTLTCCDIYNNAGGDWVGCIEDQLGARNNVSVEPQFCSLTPDDDVNWTLQSDSPCASANNQECGQIGAWPAECGASAVERGTWGRMKTLFR